MKIFLRHRRHPTDSTYPRWETAYYRQAPGEWHTGWRVMPKEYRIYFPILGWDFIIVFLWGGK